MNEKTEALKAKVDAQLAFLRFGRFAATFYFFQRNMYTPDKLTQSRERACKSIRQSAIAVGRQVDSASFNGHIHLVGPPGR